MTDIRIVEFHPRHVEVMKLRNIEAEGSFSLDDAYQRIDKIAKGSTHSGTFVYDGRIIFCAGFHVLWPGVLEVWMISSEYLKTTPPIVARVLRRYVEQIASTFKAHRIQTTSYMDPFHARWMEFLGFKNETPGGMKNFTHTKKDMCIYARLFNG